jgi:hypothetical protein
MSEQVKFGEIDFEAIEYRNEYRHTKAVFAFVAALVWMWLPPPPSSSEEDFVFWIFAMGACLSFFALALTAGFIRYKSRLIISGQGLILKRPLLKDVEIAYWEIGEVQVNGLVVRESCDGDAGPIDLSKAMRKCAIERNNNLKLRSRDGKRKIAVEQSLENFDRFCDDLNEHWRSAIDRYLGYAKGTSVRQPERRLKTWDTPKAQGKENRDEGRNTVGHSREHLGAQGGPR